MQVRSIFLMLVQFVVLTACSTITVRSDYDRSYDFSKYKTYRWSLESELNRRDALKKNPLVEKRVHASIDNDLQAKGYTKKEVGKADFVVVAHAGVKEKMHLDQYGGGYYGWYHPWWGPYGGYSNISYYKEGTLVIDIVDSENKELAWRGTGTDVVKDYKNGEKMQKDIDSAVAEILAKFPPESASAGK